MPAGEAGAEGFDEHRATSEGTMYRLDRELRIVSVAGPWDEFACENEGPSACAERVVGHCIRAFITGDVTWMWFEALVCLARLRGRPVEREYRCDSPHCRRFMRMRTIPEPFGILRIEHTLVLTEARRRPAWIRGTVDEATAGMRRRSVCGRVHRMGEWREPDEAVAPCEAELRVAYAVCGQCLA